jgi:hypothetical protein
LAAAGGTPVYELGQDLLLKPRVSGGVQVEVKTATAVPDFTVSQDALSLVARDATGNIRRLSAGRAQVEPARGIGVAGGGRLVEAAGTFYLVPAEHEGGWSQARPVCTHGGRLADFCFWQGRVVLAGLLEPGNSAGQMIHSADGRASVWSGQPGDLQRLGKPCGDGLVWKMSQVEMDKPSEPFLMWGYDRKTLEITNHGQTAFVFAIEVDPLGRGAWIRVADLVVLPGARRLHDFPPGFAAHWVRLMPGNAGQVSAGFRYR